MKSSENKTYNNSSSPKNYQKVQTSKFLDQKANKLELQEGGFGKIFKENRDMRRLDRNSLLIHLLL